MLPSFQELDLPAYFAANEADILFFFEGL